MKKYNNMKKLIYKSSIVVLMALLVFSCQEDDYQVGDIVAPTNIQISVDKNNEGPPQAPPINIEVSGEGKYDDIIAEAEKIK